MREGLVREGCVVLNTENLRGAITLGGFTMEWLAQRSGIHITTLRRWKQGKIKNVIRENLTALAQTMNIHEDALIVKANQYHG